MKRNDDTISPGRNAGRGRKVEVDAAADAPTVAVFKQWHAIGGDVVKFDEFQVLIVDAAPEVWRMIHHLADYDRSNLRQRVGRAGCAGALRYKMHRAGAHVIAPERNPLLGRAKCVAVGKSGQIRSVARENVGFVAFRTEREAQRRTR